MDARAPARRARLRGPPHLPVPVHRRRRRRRHRRMAHGDRPAPCGAGRPLHRRAGGCVRAARAVPERAEAVILAGPTFPPAARRWWPLVARVVRTFPTSRSVRCGRRFPSTCAAAVDFDVPADVDVGQAAARRRGPTLPRGDHTGRARRAGRPPVGGSPGGRRPRGIVITVPGAHNFPYTHPHAAASAVRRVAAGLPFGSDQRTPRPPSGNDQDGVA